jgi:hypothetical protein
MNERVVPKTINFCVAYMDGAGGVPSVRRPGEAREQERKLCET